MVPRSGASRSVCRYFNILPLINMHDDNSGQAPGRVKSSETLLTALFIFGLIAPLITFFLAVSSLSVDVKTVLLVALIIIYLAICTWLYKRAKREYIETPHVIPPVEFITEMPVIDHAPFTAFDEIKDFFGPSLKTEDVFRLVSNRVDRLFQFSTSVLFVPDAATSTLNAVCAYGQGAELLKGVSNDISAGIAGLAFHSSEVEIDDELRIESRIRDSFVNGHVSAVAIPLVREGAVFAIFQMYLDRRLNYKEADMEMLNSISERISPLFLNLRNEETDISAAFADPLTDLPNERALMMVLDNQLAESQRFRNDRPLSVIAVDIKGFDIINNSYGHSTGDRLLKFTGDTIRECLRKMDFLARFTNDEFTIVLPTASEKKAAEIIARLNAAFADRPFHISEHEEISVWLNFGMATFWKDGETSGQLIEAATARKTQMKTAAAADLFWKQEEYLN